MGFSTVAMGLLIVTGTSFLGMTKLTLPTKSGTNGKGWSMYRSGAYCGPGWGFTYQDILDGKIARLPDAVDAIDQACKLHDYCYHENGYLTQGCNLVLTYDLVQVVVDPKSTPQQRLDATLMAAIFFIESQLVDLPVLGVRKLNALRDELEALMQRNYMTLEQAITHVLLRGRSL